MRARIFLKATLIIVAAIFIFNGCDSAKAKSDVNGVYAEYLRCEYRENPLGIMEVKPRLSWWLSHKDSDQRGQKQKAYRILVASSQALLDKNKGDLCDTRKVESDEQLHIVYAGKPLQSRMQCYWKVCIWDNHGNKKWSKPAFWSMGLLNSGDWKAKWIARRTQEDWEKQDKARLEAEAAAKPDFLGGDQWSWYQVHKENCDAAPLFRWEFKVKSEIKRAIAYVTGLGYYQFYINGNKVGDHVLDPGWTDYSKRVLYEVYDVTDQLRNGNNVAGMMVGRGFYHQLQGGYGFRNCHWTGQPKALLQLEIETVEGKHQVITTDSTWKVIGGPIIYDAPRLGEIQDARLARNGWNQPNYDDKEWEKVNIAPAPKGNLCRQMLEPIRVRKKLKPQKITEPKPGIYVYDLGQNIAGWPRITIDGRGHEGRRITIRVNSALNDDGTVSKRLYSYWTQDYNFILEGKANEIFEPCFRYAGFRYIEIQNLPYKANGDEAVGCHVCSDVKDVGHFSCSNEIINRVLKNIRWTQRNNMHSIPEDCPNREKRGWTGDAHVTAEEAIFNFHSPLFLSKFIRDLQDGQPENGRIPRHAPIANFWPYEWNAPAWSGAYIIIPWYLYNYYGDKRILERHYDSFKRYIESIEETPGIGKVKPENPHIVGGGYGDWIAPFEDPTNTNTTPPEGTWMIHTCYYQYCVQLMSKIASVLNHSDDANYYSSLANDIADAINKEFFDPQKNIYHGNSPSDYRQTCNVFPLWLGIVPKGHRKAVIDNLINNIMVTHNGHLNTGFHGTKYLMELLPTLDRADVAYTIASQTTFPSWGWQIKKYGATTIPETWWGNIQRNDHFGSRNHPALGSVASYYYKTIGGIKPDPVSVGFKRFIVSPMPTGDLEWAQAEYESVRGLIKSHWHRKNGKLEMELTVPVNTSAKVIIPTENPESVVENGKSVQNRTDIRVLETKDDALVLSVGSGTYHFSAKAISAVEK